MAFEFDDLIGAGESFTTIAAWEVSRNVSSAWTGDRRGRLKAEAFNEEFDASGGGDTGSTHRLVLTSDPGTEHNGTSDSVSSIGNARIKGSNTAILIGQPLVDVSWIELNYEFGEGVSDKFFLSNAGDDCRAHHNVICSERFDADDSFGFELENNNTGSLLYRNSLYWFEKAGFTLDNAVATVLLNTCHRTGTDDVDRSGIWSTNSSAVIENNAVFEVDTRGGDCIIADAGALDNNATSDATGTAGLINLTTSDEIRVDSLDFTTIDLRIKDNTATLFQAANKTYSTTTYPEIDVPISDRNANVTGTWSIGSDDIVAAGSPWYYYAQMEND